MYTFEFMRYNLNHKIDKWKGFQIERILLPSSRQEQDMVSKSPPERIFTSNKHLWNKPLSKPKNHTSIKFYFSTRKEGICFYQFISFTLWIKLLLLLFLYRKSWAWKMIFHASPSGKELSSKQDRHLEDLKGWTKDEAHCRYIYY